jgi:hydroxyacylglutathione hydrolase
MFDVVRIPAFKDNYIWLLRKGGAAIVVDPGDAGPVLEVLERERLALEAILVTHHHQDHQGGIASLLDHSRVDVFGPAGESITGLSRPLSGGETVWFDSLAVSFEVIAIPGHTSGHIAYLAANHLFCGDTLFAGGCGRVFEGTPVQMFDSLSRLARLPDETLIFCAHEYTEANLRFALAVEPDNRRLCNRVADVTNCRAAGQASVPSTLAIEKATNPFLRCTEPVVRAAAKRQGALSDEPVEVFAALRAWKNSF